MTRLCLTADALQWTLTIETKNLPGFTGPSSLNWDAALTKKVRIGESKTFSVRADLINVLNKPIWGNPNMNINSTQFGRITTATGNRSVTFNARIDF